MLICSGFGLVVDAKEAIESVEDVKDQRLEDWKCTGGLKSSTKI
jgi:hypothetical protein